MRLSVLSKRLMKNILFQTLANIYEIQKGVFEKRANFALFCIYIFEERAIKHFMEYTHVLSMSFKSTT